VYPHSTVQPTVQQYRERSPSPYVRMKEEGESDKELYNNEPTIWAGNREDSLLYRRKYLCQSTHDRYERGRLDGAVPETVIQPPTSKAPLGPRNHPTHYRLGGLKQKRY
jgi:hypothetical protein